MCFSKIAWKKIVKLAVHERVQNVLRDEINRYSKLRDGPMTTEDFELRQYIRNMNISDARVNFSIRSKMLNCKFNYKNDFINDRCLWRCDSCQTQIDTQSHILVCPAYSGIRDGKDMSCDKDLISYIRQVMLVREKLDLMK